MKLRKIFAVVVVLCCFCPIFAQKMRIKVATVVPGSSSWDDEQHVIAQKWLKISNGDIALKFMGTVAMGGEDGVIQKLNSVRPGQVPPINGAVFTSIGISELAPESNILTLCVPFMFRNQNEVNLVLKEFSEEMQKPILDKGYVVLGWFSVGWAYFYTKKPAQTPEALKSQRLSVGSLTSPALTNAFKAAGFLTLDVPEDKLLQSMKTPGGIEGLYTLPMYAFAAQYYKNLPYILNVPLCPVMAAFVLSKETWSAVPETYKPALIAAVKEAEVKFNTNQIKDDAEYLKRCQEAGCTLTTLTSSEYSVYERSFRNDSVKMYEARNPVVNKELYDKIIMFLNKNRGN